MPEFRAGDGRRLFYRDAGAGPTVLCLAGLSRNGRDFEALAARLAPRFRVLRLDSRGRGESERAADPIAEYQVPVEAGDALALLDHLGLEGAGIVGTSRGGILGMAMASGRPGSVRALVLNDVGAVVEMRGLLRILAYLGRDPGASDFAEAAAALEAANAAQFPGVSRARWAAHARAIYDDDGAGRPVLAYDPRLRTATASAMDADVARIDLWPLFESVEALPVLVIRGANSDVLSARTLARMSERHPGLEWRVAPDRGHAPFLDEPGIGQAIEDFLGRALA